MADQPVNPRGGWLPAGVAEHDRSACSPDTCGWTPDRTQQAGLTDDTRTPEEREAARKVADWDLARKALAVIAEDLRRADRLLRGLDRYDEQCEAMLSLIAKAGVSVRYARLIGKDDDA